ncbi:MAG: hypothetical protein HY655_06525 [Acidobacteria bacterium]|nr:hypothetical protein [Acidobacteriota bacterium]
MRTALAIGLLVAASAADLQAQSLLVSGGTLIDGTGRSPVENAYILVRDGVITEVTTSPPSAAGVAVVDARGKYILPGLIDSHVHYRNLYNPAPALRDVVPPVVTVETPPPGGGASDPVELIVTFR